jgi:HlyD family secretion protein
MAMPTDEPQAAPAPSARNKAPDPHADTPKIHGDTGKPSALSKKWPASSTRLPSTIVGLVVAAVAGLSIWYLVRPQPLLVQGEVDATRFDLAARVDGRVAEIPVERGQNIDARAVLVKIDNPETIAKERAGAGRQGSQLANINAGTRAEVIAARKAALERAEAGVVLAQKNHDRTSQLAASAQLGITCQKPLHRALERNEALVQQ